MPTPKQKHPITFYIILFWQFWWAFSFYGLWSLLPVYLNKYLEMSQSSSFAIFGGYTALGAGLLFIGGWIADNYLGAKRNLTIGTIFQSLGYFLVAMSAINKATLPLFLGLGFVVIGRATGSTCPPVILASAYKDSHDPRLDGAFTYLYMVNNVGSFLTMMIIPAIASMVSMSIAFALCGTGMAISVVGLLVMRGAMKESGSAPDKVNAGVKKYVTFLIGSLIAVCISAYLLTNLVMARSLMGLAAVVICFMIIKNMKQEAPDARKHMMVGLALMLQAMIFFVLYNQMPTSLNFFAINNVIPEIFGMTVDPVQYQALNPLWIIILSPILAKMYSYLGARNKDLSMPGKYALGMIICGIAFGSAGISQYFADENGMVSSFWIITPNLFFAIGELLISALGMSVIAKLFPERIRAFSFGAWNMTLALSSFIGAWVAGFSAVEGGGATAMESLTAYGNYFNILAVVTIVIGIIIALLVPKLNSQITDKPAADEEHEGELAHA
ncbi:Dipeptide and tripeptide permease B [invertebrate metagenome]|uniref:Dipeptide and tripeptide permease B n=1 Tax=invertebrate metagenome TaxID=1711999 RepID=A0A2H9T3L5_9ZZZZ